jgi:exopolysaccharide biosynthesis polyprenyl glycosylphosphotransferase
MLSHRDRALRLGLFLSDGLIAAVCLVAAATVRGTTAFAEIARLEPLALDPGVYLSVAIAALFSPWALRRCGAYSCYRRQGLGQVLVAVGKGCGFAAVGLLTVGAVFGLAYLEPAVVGLYSVLFMLALTAERIALFAWLREMRKRGRNQRTFVVIGTGPRARAVAEHISSNPSWGLRNLGFLDDHPTVLDAEILQDQYLGSPKDLAELLTREVIDEVVVVLPRQALCSDTTAEAVAICEAVGVDVTVATDLFELQRAKASFHELLGVPGMTLSSYQRRPIWALALKRMIDLAGGLGILLLTAPLWLVTAIAIKLESPGPVFFVQRRNGLRGRTFPFLKFRTMYKDAEARLAELRERNEVSGPVFKMKDDPRVTRVGRVLRKFSIDELPQLLNVLVGHMSLVGPRPPIPSEVDLYDLAQRRRLSVRPGLTCIWQVEGRSSIQFDDWVALDLKYIDQWSLALDLRLLLKTIPAVLSARGAS